MPCEKQINLTRGMVTIVDIEDFDLLNKYKWYAHNTGKSFYAATNVEGKIIYLHKLLLNDVGIVDHINGNTLDNRRCNLRYVTMQQNAFNSKSRNDLPKGVCFDKQTGKYIAQIMFNGKNIKIGRFNSIDDAAIEYNKRAKLLFGEFARI